ncbi:MAG: hypothetical protein ACYC5A_01190 [Thermoleophilia bacterium]
MKSQIKTILFISVIALFVGGNAIAATSGQIPLVDNGLFSNENVGNQSFLSHGETVSEVARNKEAIGSKTNPNGKVIENHGQAVREAAHEKAGGNPPDHSNAGGNSPDNSNAGGNPPDHSNAGGNSPDNSNAGGNAGGNPNR